MKPKDETKLIQCPYLKVKKRRRKQTLEDMLDIWQEEAKKDKKTFSYNAQIERNKKFKQRS